MQQKTLHILIEIFAAQATNTSQSTQVLTRSLVEAFLQQQFSASVCEQYLLLYDGFRQAPPPTDTEIYSKVKSINSALNQTQKLLILLYLIDIDINSQQAISPINETLVRAQKIAGLLRVNKAEFDNCYAFARKQYHRIRPRENFHTFDGNNTISGSVSHYTRVAFAGQLSVFFIRSARLYLFRYQGIESLRMNHFHLFSNHIYLLPKGSTIRNVQGESLNYNEITNKFSPKNKNNDVILTTHAVEYRFPNSNNGIKPLSICAQSGQLVAIMGGSGVGKSTLLNILSGTLPPQQGSVCLNGVDIFAQHQQTIGQIGFVPQDEMLVEELTVFENLYLSAKLCIGDKTDFEIQAIVDQLIIDLDLLEARKLTVGSPLNKFISGGQRKRLNIGLELLRQPSVLFVDEPTSGLSSADAENIIDLLKEQANNNKLVIINIHQPSAEIFKLFDKLLILDKGGHAIYCGNPADATMYFKKALQMADITGASCNYCQQSSPDELLELVENKRLNSFGEYTDERVKSPEEWYQLFLQSNTAAPLKESQPLPLTEFARPGYWQQFKIFSQRNLLTKVANVQYMLISLLEAPILACVLAYFTKHTVPESTQYHLYANDNIPAYFFMSVIVALFLGLIISSEEIIKDSKIRKRENFLHLSRTAYINSKVVYLFALSALQAISFVLIGNYILRIHDLTVYHFLIFWATACLANIIGLNLSANLRSVIAIYISIPFILIPQILLGGTIVDYQKLNNTIRSHQYTPWISDLMATRWSYEALMVSQFAYNRYEAPLFAINQQQSNSFYQLSVLIPELQSISRQCGTDVATQHITDTTRWAFAILNTQLATFEKGTSIPRLTPENFMQQQPRIDVLIRYNKKNERQRNAVIIHRKDSILRALVAQTDLATLRNKYSNKKVAEIVNQNFDKHIIIRHHDLLIRNTEPIYQKPHSTVGRAPFYVAQKQIGRQTFSTFAFNLAVLWLMTAIAYIALITNIFKRCRRVGGVCR